MQTISQLSISIKQLAKNQVGSYVKKAALIASHDGLALIKKRVISNGENSNGNKFDPYSDNPLPYFFFDKKGRSGSKTAFEKAKKLDIEKDGISYKEWRQANNLQVKNKDFKFTGRLWGNIKPTLKSEIKGKIIIDLNAIDNEEKRKLEYVSQRDGNILTPNKSERDFIQKSYLTSFIKQIYL